MRVLVAGGGFAGAEAVLELRALAGDRVEIELVSMRDTLVYRPHAVREPFGLGDTEQIPLRPLCAAHDVALRLERVMAVDVAGRSVQTERSTLAYDVLLVATGARRQPAVEGAITFDGLRGIVELRRLLDRATAGDVRGIAFVVPRAVAWPLPLYELAFLTQAHLREHGADVRLHLVTGEPEPLGLFGKPAADRVRRALSARGIALQRPDDLRRLRPDAVVALPRVVGPALRGLPANPDGFVRVDEYGRVDGTACVYAAGDATDFPVKQGGLATQQAATAAAHIAARSGAPVDPRPFAPVLRALLLTGAIPVHLRGGRHPAATSRPPWPDRAKVIGTRLSRWLGVDEPADRPQGEELALTLADDEAARGSVGIALEWLAAAEAFSGELPPDYVRKRRAWTVASEYVSSTGTG